MPCMPEPAPICLLFNVRSGSREAEADRAAIVRMLAQAARPHRIFDVPRPAALATIANEAATRARECGGILAVAGGDGTINAAAQAALALDVPLGVLPRGTFNYFSRAHRIPLDTEAAVANLLGGETQPVHVGLVNGRVFLVNASIGLYPELLHDREIYKREYGRNRFVALCAAVVTLMKPHGRLTLTYEHEGHARRVRTPTLFVGNNALQLAQIGLPEAQDVEDGQLAAIIVRTPARPALLRLLLMGAAGTMADCREVERFAFRELTVHPRLPRLQRDIEVATDGEVARLATPLVFRVSPQKLRLIAPRPQESAS